MQAVNILVVDDNLTIAELLAEVIADLGHTVCAIEVTELGAVTAAAQHRPDLMIVDVRLGHGSGVVAVDTIIRSRPVPHIFVSGDIAQVLALRPNAVTLQKPYSEAALITAMERALATAD